MTTDKHREWVLACGARYWPRGAQPIAALPVPELTPDQPGSLLYISLPKWAADIGVDGQLLAFADCISGTSESPDWSRCDWLTVAWHMLTSSFERVYEADHGPILSYSFRLPSDLQPLFERAWVNRIFLFLRRWAALKCNQPEEQLFGPLPKATILLTHDVDAISLTPEIRLKQTAFQLTNAAIATTHGRVRRARRRLAAAARYIFSIPNLRTLSLLRDMEQAAGLRSTLHFYGGPAGLLRSSPRRILIDPAYDIRSPYLRTEIKALVDGGWQLGLHQSFDAWAKPEPMEKERIRIEQATASRIVYCRQHWLHFSWAATWSAQQKAGLLVDSTLGFNDRAGFRSGHALRIRPWNFSVGAPMELETVPMLFMDSHFYDYGDLDEHDIGPAMKRWLDEVRVVRGEATVNWHSHTITSLCGWRRGFEDLLSQIR